MMSEQFLHFIWQQRLFRSMPQQTTDGREVQVIDPGQLNIDSGPDFFNAKVIIGGVYWAGNVEVHCRASEWYHHGHQNDKAYDNIILHVIVDNDMEVRRTDGSLIPQMVLRYPAHMEALYEKWCADKGLIACRDMVAQLPNVLLHNWFEVLSVERLNAKSAAIDLLTTNVGGDIEQTFYIMLARAFGFHTNSVPFELTARSLPLKVIERHRGNRLQVEALLFGQASLLKPVDEYSSRLIAEHSFLRHKFNLSPINPTLWKWMRMRPGGFPTIRMAQLAQLLYSHERLMGLLTETLDVPDIIKVLRVVADGYWDTRYDFGDAGTRNLPKQLGERSAYSLIINVVFPFVYYRGIKQDNTAKALRALEMLASLPPEDNSVIKQWRTCGIVPQNALDTQALLQLTEKYCKNHGCLSCRLAYKMLNKV